MNDVLSYITLAFFVAASGIGIYVLNQAKVLRQIILFSTLTMIFNAIFRAYTSGMRLLGEPLPQPFTTSAALTLQLMLAATVTAWLVATVAVVVLE